MISYWYNGAYIYDEYTAPYVLKYFADCYPARKRWEPTTILGPFDTKQEAEEAVDKAP